MQSDAAIIYLIFLNILAQYKAKTKQQTKMEKLKKEGSLKRKLGLFDAAMLVMGSMIGSGIFIVSADIMRNLGLVTG